MIDYSIRHLNSQWCEISSFNVNLTSPVEALNYALDNSPLTSRLIHIRRGGVLLYSCRFVDDSLWSVTRYGK